jgi:hypothetical protein
VLIVLPIFIIGCVLSGILPWRFLKRKGFVRAGSITLLSILLGIFLPMGSLLGFLGLGYVLERDARPRT